MITRTIVDEILDHLQVAFYSRCFSEGKDAYVQLSLELKCLNFYVLCFEKFHLFNFGFVEKSNILAALKEASKRYGISKSDILELLETIQQWKPKIEEDCLIVLDCTFPFSPPEISEFMSSISVSLHSLLRLKADMILDEKVKIQSLTENLDLFIEVLEFTPKLCSTYEDLNDYRIHIQAWACRAACLSLLCWVQDVKEETMAARRGVILPDLQKSLLCWVQDAARRGVILSDLPKAMSPTPEVIRMYLTVLKASKPLEKDRLKAVRLVMKFVHFLKDNLQVNPETDSIQMLFLDLIFWITFLMDPAYKHHRGEFILIEDAIVHQVPLLISAFCSDEIKHGITTKWNRRLQTFLKMAKAAKVVVRELYPNLFPDPSSSNFPSVNGLGFIDSLLENLKEFFFHFPNYQMLMLREELLSLRQSNLKDFSILAMQNKHKDVGDLWTRIINVAYNAERAISSFIFIKDALWYDILCLSDVIKEVELIKVEMKRIEGELDIYSFNSETSPVLPLSLQANMLTVDNVFVGFNEEIRQIQDQLMSESKELHIITILGMPGLGKTTLAKKVYNDTSVQHRFHKLAWCTVSQQFDRKKIFLQILNDIVVSDDDLSKEEEEDLEERICKSLRGQRYLVVLDDIWDVSAWDALRMSFPEDNNGSRIMLTSRNHNVISKAKFWCRLFPLSPLSKETSWELLEKKLDDKGRCSPYLVETGRQIATKCKGIPLVIVLIAGLLKTNIESLEWWKQVRGNLEFFVAKEGWREILELSYKHLPEYLKSCFLYFGLFQEDEEIRVKRLIQLWISEGLIQKHKTKSLEVMAEEYLKDLAARSLVIVNKRSSTGGIKACSVHDLLQVFCRAKAEEEKVIKVIRGKEEDRSMTSTFANYQVSIRTCDCWESLLEYVPVASSIHSILDTSDPYSYSEFVNPFTRSYFRLCRVLESNLFVRKLPIEKLILLRYLSINFNYHIPSSIKRLENLETLRCDSPVYLPLTLWEMQKLRHISGDLRLPHFPPDHDLSLLENVQTFSIRISYKETEIFFRTIPKVRKLKCQWSVDDPEPHQIVRLDFLNHLESLSMEFKISYAIRDSSPIFYFPWTLKKLTLKCYQSKSTGMSEIMKLPNLEVLKLYNGIYEEIWNVKDEEFVKLRCLVLKMFNTKQLNASDDSFPCLEHLELENCYSLKELPTRFGSISTLKKIRVRQCKSILSNSVKQIQEEQVDLGNEDLEVLILEPL